MRRFTFYRVDEPLCRHTAWATRVDYARVSLRREVFGFVLLPHMIERAP